MDNEKAEVLGGEQDFEKNLYKDTDFYIGENLDPSKLDELFAAVMANTHIASLFNAKVAEEVKKRLPVHEPQAAKKMPEFGKMSYKQLAELAATDQVLYQKIKESNNAY